MVSLIETVYLSIYLAEYFPTVDIYKTNAYGIRKPVTMKKKRNYFYFLMTFLLFWVFVYFAFESWDKYKAARVSTNVREQKLLHLQYPSVTVCPEKTFNTVQRIPSSPTTFEAVRKFYLDNVRSLQELKAMLQIS